MRNSNPKIILAVIIGFFIFQLFLFVKSFPAEYGVYLGYLNQVPFKDPFWNSVWFASELTGEVGLTIRFAGACFAIAFALILVAKRQKNFPLLRKAVLFEGTHYLFTLPFIVFFFARPNTSIAHIEAGLSYLLQIVLVTPPFLIVYTKMKKQNLDNTELYKWSAIAIVNYTFALWVNHFFLSLYALPISFANPILLTGLLNSTFTIFFAGLILSIALLPIIRKKQFSFNSKIVGATFLLVGTYSVIYVAISFLNWSYFSFLTLTELWAITFVITGIGFIAEKHSRNQRR